MKVNTKIDIIFKISILTFIAALIFGTATILFNQPKENHEDNDNQTEEIHDIKAEQQLQLVVEQPVKSIKEIKWEEAQAKMPPLSASSGVGYSNGWKLTYYPSRRTYHYLTPTWSLGTEHKGLKYYMEWNEWYTEENGQLILHQDWCFVVSINKGYQMMNQVIQFDFGPCVVRDSGCAMGTVDMYVY